MRVALHPKEHGAFFVIVTCFYVEGTLVGFYLPGAAMRISP